MIPLLTIPYDVDSYKKVKKQLDDFFSVKIGISKKIRV